VPNKRLYRQQVHQRLDHLQAQHVQQSSNAVIAIHRSKQFCTCAARLYRHQQLHQRLNYLQAAATASTSVAIRIIIKGEE
jgi:hypothetical protein